MRLVIAASSAAPYIAVSLIVYIHEFGLTATITWLQADENSAIAQSFPDLFACHVLGMQVGRACSPLLACAISDLGQEVLQQLQGQLLVPDIRPLSFEQPEVLCGE